MIPVEFFSFGIACLIAGFLAGRMTKPTRKVTEIVGYERDQRGRFQKAVTR